MQCPRTPVSWESTFRMAVNRANRKLILVFSYLAFVIFFTITIRHFQRAEFERRRPKPRPEKLVLSWNDHSPSNRPLWKPGVMKYLDNRHVLPHTCRVTTNRQAILEADTVIFHGISAQYSKQELKSIREQAGINTTFVLFMRDPPTYTGPLSNDYNGFFDITATYRLVRLFTRFATICFRQFHFAGKVLKSICLLDG